MADDLEGAIGGKLSGTKIMPFSHGRVPVNAILMAEQAHADRNGFDRVKVGLNSLPYVVPAQVWNPMIHPALRPALYTFRVIGSRVWPVIAISRVSSRGRYKQEQKCRTSAP